MVKYLSNIPISRRLFVTFLIAAAIPAIVIIVLGNYYLALLNTRSEAVQTSFDAQGLASTEQANLQRMNALVQTRFNQIFASLSGKVSDPSLANAGGLVSSDIAAREFDFDRALQNYQTNFDLATSPNMTAIRSVLINDNPSTGPRIITDQREALSSVATGLWPRYRRLQKQEINLLDSLDPTILQNPTTLPTGLLSMKYEQAYFLLWQANNQFTDLSNNWQRVVDDSVAMGKTVTSVGPSVIEPFFSVTIIAVILAFAIIFFAGWLVNLTVTRPLLRLANLTKRIGMGDTSARARLQGRDEIALVSQSMNRMLDNIVQLIRTAQSEHDNLQRQVEKLVSEVSGVGEGDLRIQAEVTPDSLGVLADSFNYMVEELSSLVIRVKVVASEVESSTTMSSERMSQLVEVSGVQLDRITKAVVDVERMANSSRQVAELAQVLHRVAGEARQTAQTGREAVQQMVEGMGRIDENVQDTARKVQSLAEHSHEINSLIEVISTIAHQTNRLALDAAIQAAMAGENGKGFGPIASDIRRLAENAKTQLSEVGRIVRSVREEIGTVAISMRDTEREARVGAAVAGEAGSSLDSIISVVERQARGIGAINQMAMQQQQSSNGIVAVMQSLSTLTQQNSDTTRGTANSMERLTRLAKLLLMSVEAFKLPNDQFVMAQIMEGLTVTPVEENAEQGSLSGVFRAVTGLAQPTAVGRGYPARTPANSGSYPPPPYSTAGQRQDNTWPPTPSLQWSQQPLPPGNGGKRQD